MTPLMSDKRAAVTFVPYRTRTDGAREFFLQKRDSHAPVHANIFSLFGGGIESDESLKDALIREIQEELVYRPNDAQYFCVFETDRGIFHTFIESVESDFETIIDVQEGEYGKFLSLMELEHEHAARNASDIVLITVRAMDGFLPK